MSFQENIEAYVAFFVLVAIALVPLFLFIRKEFKRIDKETVRKTKPNKRRTRARRGRAVDVDDDIEGGGGIEDVGVDGGGGGWVGGGDGGACGGCGGCGG